ncbi:MAG: helix-hairpin-helix domain-containing protein [Gaiellaceae bacterium]
MPDIQVSRRALVLGALALALALALANRVLRDAGTAYEAPVAHASGTSPAVPRSLVVVDVVGAVRRAGVYRLPQGSRIADALARAGGATRKAELDLVNLAAPLADGSQIVVPARMATAPRAAGGGPSEPAGPVHLNSATEADLDALPGVGPVTAQQLLDFRQPPGAFGTVDELDAIPGIGPKRLDQLRELVAP